MKTSVLKSALLKKRASMEQGDISIVVNQDGKETDGVDPAASMPPELTDPTASIADQPEVNEAVAPATTDDAATLDEGDIAGQMAQDDAGVQEGEDALEAMESYLGTIRRLRAERMPVSQASIEALNVGIDAALGRWNITAREIGIMPSHESFAANPMASLESMEKELVASMEGIADKINDFVNKNTSRLFDLIDNIGRTAVKQKARLAKVVQVARTASSNAEYQPITKPKIIDGIELVAQDGKSSGDVAKNIAMLSESTIEFFDKRLETVQTATIKAINTIKEKGGTPEADKIASEQFREDVTNLMFADNRKITFVTALSAAQVAVGATTGYIGVAINTVIIASTIYKAMTDKALYKVPSFLRKKKAGTAVLNQVPALTPADAIRVAEELGRMLDAVANYAKNKNSSAKKLISIVDYEFKQPNAHGAEQAGKDYVAKNPLSTQDADEVASSIRASMGYVRKLLREMYWLEGALIRGVRYSIPGVVDYVVESARRYGGDD